MDENTRKSATPQPCRFERFGPDSLKANWCALHGSFRVKDDDTQCYVVTVATAPPAPSASAVDTASGAELETCAWKLIDESLCAHTRSEHDGEWTGRTQTRIAPGCHSFVTEAEMRTDINPESRVTMWDIHTCKGVPIYRCAACWATAYDPDSAKLTANLFRIGYYEPLKRDAECLDGGPLSAIEGGEVEP